GRLRVMMEPFAAKRPADTDESVYDFASRRIGREAADYLVQPMVSGVYGGVAERLSLRACFPIMAEMEAQYGSLVKAMIAKKKQARAAGKKSGGPSGPGGWLTSFRGGLYRLIERFNERYGEFIRTEQAVAQITRENEQYSVQVTDGEALQAKHVVLALPAYATAPIVAPLSTELAHSFSAIPYAPIAVVCSGYPKSAVTRELDGFGFLVPRKEQMTILGSIWTSSIFTERAPANAVQFRTMVGGDGDHDSVNLSDDDLLARVNRDLDRIVGLRGDPSLVKIYRWSHGIPQFRIGHGDVMNRIESQLTELGNLYIAGNAYYGIGLNDCVKQAWRVAQAIS
ncbi:protoporphyrinogen oxidase, partial [candidate division GN15 bacterium]|nr:protoporphyrinogen oxidase [candidate division GN15 bacterium]